VQASRQIRVFLFALVAPAILASLVSAMPPRDICERLSAGDLPLALTVSPANSSVSLATTVSLTALASDPGHRISRVQFYGGASLIGEQTTSPYQVVWRTAAPGTYDVTALALDRCDAPVGSASLDITVTPPAGSGPGGRLLQLSDLEYQGSFRLPAGTIGDTSFSYGGTALAYEPTHNSLFVVGHDWQQEVAEISIPQPLSSDNLNDLPVATVLQPFADVTDGMMDKVGTGTAKIGGLLSYQGKLYASVYLYYDAPGTQQLSHYSSGENLSVVGDARGPYRVGSLGAGFVSGYFGLVPPDWQSSFGGPVLNGQCCINIISRTSYGPALFAEDPSKLGTVRTLPAASLVYYPSDDPLAAWDSSSPEFNGATEIRGVVFPEGTRSVLFFGRHGLGTFCYGEGTDNRSLTGKTAPSGATYCFDPDNSSKGTHGYPYSYAIWAYDANDLASVKRGQKSPWSVKPYALWTLSLPFDAGQKHIGGVAYNPKEQLIYVSQQLAEMDGDEARPIIHVFKVR
jgi:hypothetical protein